MRTRVFVSRLLCPARATAITLFGLVFTRNRRSVTPRVLNHELIHCCQQLEWLYLPFFVLYGLEWLINFIRYRDFDKAYRRISFEREAYENDGNPDYIASRRHFANYRRKRN